MAVRDDDTALAHLWNRHLTQLGWIVCPPDKMASELTADRALLSKGIASLLRDGLMFGPVGARRARYPWNTPAPRFRAVTPLPSTAEPRFRTQRNRNRAALPHRPYNRPAASKATHRYRRWYSGPHPRMGAT